MHARLAAFASSVTLATTFATGQMSVVPSSLSSQHHHQWIAGGPTLEPSEFTQNASSSGSQTSAAEKAYTLWVGDDPATGFPIFSRRSIRSTLSTTFASFGDSAFQINQFAFVTSDMPAVSLYDEASDRLRFSVSKTEDYGVIWSAASNTHSLEYALGLFAPGSGWTPIVDIGNGTGQTTVRLTAGVEYQCAAFLRNTGGYRSESPLFMQGIGTFYVLPSPSTIAVQLLLLALPCRRR